MPYFRDRDRVEKAERKLPVRLPVYLRLGDHPVGSGKGRQAGHRLNGGVHGVDLVVMRRLATAGVVIVLEDDLGRERPQPPEKRVVECVKFGGIDVRFSGTL